MQEMIMMELDVTLKTVRLPPSILLPHRMQS